MPEITRRRLVASGAALGALSLLPGCGGAGEAKLPEDFDPESLFKISLAQWSLNRSLFGDNGNPPTLTALEFPRVAKQVYGIDAVEYVNTFYRGKEGDVKYLADLKRVTDGEGVKSLLIMCDGEGRVGEPDANARATVIENHKKWVDMAAFLGCRAVRVNAASEGSYEDQQRYVAEGLRGIAEYADQSDLSVLVENHGGLSSNGEWLSSVMGQVEMANVGTLPDFGNFSIGDNEDYDPYLGVEQMMPFARAVSAKTHGFKGNGDEKSLDYERMLNIVLKAGYRGYIGIEYEGDQLSEHDGIIKTKELLERVRLALAPGFV